MANGPEHDNDGRWVDDRLDSLGDPETSPLDLLRAHARLQARHLEAARRRRTWTTGAAVVGITVVGVAVVLASPWPRAAAQRLWDRLTIRRVEVVQFGRTGVPDTVKDVFEWHDAKREEPIVVSSIDEAERLAGFRPSLPPAGLMKTAPRLSVVKNTVYATSPLKTAELNRALAAAGLADIQVPTAWEGATLTAEAGPRIDALYEEDMMELSQARSFKLTTRSDFPIGQFMELAFRIVGKDPAEARRLGDQFVANPAWLLIFPERDTVREVPLKAGQAVIAGDEEGMCFFWNTHERIYIIGGRRNEELATAIANSIQ